MTAGRSADPADGRLAAEERARSDASVADLVQQDLDDPATPSRRAPGGEPEPGSFDVPLRPYRKEPTDADAR